MRSLSRQQRFRPATPDDADHIIDLIVVLNRKIGMAYGIPADAETVIQTVLHTIKRGICLVGDHACAGGFIRPYPWNSHAQIGVILFWNYDRPSGIHVFEAIIKAFHEHGATHVNCASHFPDNRIASFYKRFALQSAEIQFISGIDEMKRLLSNSPASEVECLR